MVQGFETSVAAPAPSVQVNVREQEVDFSIVAATDGVSFRETICTLTSSRKKRFLVSTFSWEPMSRQSLPVTPSMRTVFVAHCFTGTSKG